MNINSRLMRHSQRGATMIVVLIMLVLLTLVGIMGIRTAMTSLNIATNSQVNQLVAQSSDTPSNYFLNNSSYENLTTPTTVVGQAISFNESGPRGREVIFCYRPTGKEKIDSAFDTTVLIPPDKSADPDTKATIDSVYTDRAGFCDLTKDFGSSREAVVTQVSVKVISGEQSVIGADLDRGSNQAVGSTEAKDLVKATIRVTSTAIMPSFARENISNIQEECIGNGSKVGYINDNLDENLKGKKTVADCLSGYGIPLSTQVQEFELRTRDIQIKAPI